MNNVIGIYCGRLVYNGQEWNGDIIRKYGGGGSETWAIELAYHLKKMGFDIIIFNDIDSPYIDEYGVNYIPHKMFNMFS